MDPIERLNSLSEDVIQTFHSDFVFLIDAEKIQHFPARNWTHDQIIEELKKRFNHSLMVTTWHEQEVIYSPELPIFALIPKK